jgi:hypothetical protein
MPRLEPYYHVVIQKDDEQLLNCSVLVTFQRVEDIRYYTTVSEARYTSIDDALSDAKLQIADFMGREWL